MKLGFELTGHGERDLAIFLHCSLARHSWMYESNLLLDLFVTNVSFRQLEFEVFGAQKFNEESGHIWNFQVCMS